ncbi:MAG: SUF system Fe-S cluster assembly protein [Kordiimonadaceae bacterium]|nr:SUF system Fe-S cluster assembly protein [Kordiimonadaceae bacterium]
MSENENRRDVMDLSGAAPEALTETAAEFPAENMPVNAPRPSVSPQEGGYFLNKFLEQSETNAEEAKAEEEKASNGAEAAGEAPESAEILQANIVEALKEIYDPEIPVNIYEMGLIYDVDVDADYNVKIRMTLTTPNCPVAESMPGEVELKAAGVTGVKSSHVDLVWDPVWTMDRMSDEARLELGLL